LGKKLKGPSLFGGSDSDSDSNSASDRDSNSDGIFGRSASDREVSVWLDPVSFDEIDEDGLEALVTVVDNDCARWLVQPLLSSWRENQKRTLNEIQQQKRTMVY
jgi:hypothetical protein